MKREASRYRFRSWQLLLALLFAILLPLQSAQAGDNFVGDGFGGRDWYVPTRMEANNSVAAYVDPSGQLYMWGDKTLLHLTILPVPSGSTDNVCPYPVAGFDDVKLVSLSDGLGALVNNNGTAYFWSAAGRFDEYGHFGQPYAKTPQQVLTDVKHVSPSSSHIAFVKNDGTVWSMGANAAGAFGVGTADTNFVTTPVQMTGMTDAVRVAAFGANRNDSSIASAATLVVKSDGTLWIAGGGGSALLPNTSPNYTATQLNISDVVAIETGMNYAMALTSNGDVYTWGNDFYAVLGHGNFPQNPRQVSEPTKVNFPIGTPPMVAIETNAQGYISFALDATGQLWAWGYRFNYETFGIAAQTLSVPYPVADNVSDVTTSERVAFLVRDSSYPTGSRLWWSGSAGSTRAHILNLNLYPTQNGGGPATTLDHRVSDGNTWTISKPETCGFTVDFSGMPGASGGGGGAGTIADVAIVKSAGVTEATTGVPFDYTLTVTNNGPAAATNVVATDLLPAGFTFNSATATDGGSCTESGGTVTCSWATMANGATVSATINVTP